MQFYVQQIEGTGEYALGFCKASEPLLFSSRAEAFAFCIDYMNGQDFEFVDVDENNWLELYESGAFDYDPDI